MMKSLIFIQMLNCSNKHLQCSHLSEVNRRVFSAKLPLIFSSVLEVEPVGAVKSFQLLR